MIELTRYPKEPGGDTDTFDLSAHGDGFQVTKEELMDFMIRAAKELNLPSLGCVECNKVPKWILVSVSRAVLVCQYHREVWDEEQPKTLSQLQWKEL